MTKIVRPLFYKIYIRIPAMYYTLYGVLFMACQVFRIGLALVLLFLFNAMPVVPETGGEIVPREPVGTRGTIVVNASGGGDYTRIQWAIDNASDGDTVYVEAGIYREAIIISGKSLTVSGEGDNRTVIESPPYTQNFSAGPPCMILESNGNTISGLSFINRTWGVRIRSVSENSVNNCSFINTGHGVDIEGGRDNVISDNYIYDNYCGIYLNDSDQNIVNNNRFIKNGMYYDSFYDSDGNGIPDDQEPGNPQADSDGDGLVNGFELNIGTDPLKKDSDDDDLWDYYELKLRTNPLDPDSDDDGIRDDEIAGMPSGLFLFNSDSSHISSNRFDDCQCILLNSSSFNSIVTNGIHSSRYPQGRKGDFLELKKGDCDSITDSVFDIACDISENIFYHSEIEIFGISLISGSNDNIVRNNRCTSEVVGIEVIQSNGNQLVDNKCEIGGQRWGPGISLIKSNHSIVANNTCESSDIGIYQYKSDNVISMNYFSNNTWAVYLVFCFNSSLINNSLHNNMYGVHVGNSSEIEINSNTFENNIWGVVCGGSNNIEIDSNKFLINDMGIQCERSNDIEIKKNRLENNTCGVYLKRSNEIEIIDNSISESGNHSILLHGSSSNVIMNNTCRSSNSAGIHISKGFVDKQSNDNEIMNNTIQSNRDHGIQILNSDDNNVYFNEFIDNNGGERQAEDAGKNNRWNCSFGGNYWSAYHANDFDGDGIIDQPYRIEGMAGSMDRKPLTAPLDELFPVADARPDTNVPQYGTLTFNGSGSQGLRSTFNFTWSFVEQGIQRYLYGPDPTFTFDHIGVYTVTLWIEDFLGRTDTDSFNVTVIDETLPMAVAGQDIMVEQHQTVILDAYLSADNEGIVNFSWSFSYKGEKIDLYGITAQYTFHDAGIFTVTLEVADAEGNRDTDTLNVTVLDITPPTADAGIDITTRQSFTVEFFFHQHSTDNVGIEDWTWTFEYNETEETLFHSIIMSSLPLFKFEIPGIYSVTMKVTDEAGNWAFDTLNVTVLDTLAPDADAGGGQETDTGTVFRFNGTGSMDNVGIVNYTWVFEYDGEEVTLFGVSPDFSFDIPGEYDIELVVTDADGNSASDRLSITVTPKDDEIGPIDNDDEEEDRGHSGAVWIWMSVVILFIAVVVVLLLFFRKRKDGSDEVSGEDELGRVGKDDGVGNDDIT